MNLKETYAIASEALENLKFTLSMHLPQEFIRKDGFIDIEAAGSLCLSGLDSYHQTIRMGRLSYAKPELDVKEMTLDGKIKNDTYGI